jgi:hypothetical protein
MILSPKRPGALIRMVSGLASRSTPASGSSLNIALWVPLFLSLIAPLAWAQPAPSIEDESALEVTDSPEANGIAARSALTQFTTAIENREPVDQVTFVENDVHKIFFFSDLRRLDGATVFHRWIYAGKTQANVEFAVMGPRWRVWSSKELDPESVGDWTVEVMTEDGETLASETFTYSAANE